MIIGDMKEIWKDVKGVEDKYECSNTGKIRRKNYTKSFMTKYGVKTQQFVAKDLQGWLGNRGYMQVQIRGRKELVHRIIAETFIPNPENLPFVNHKDENKLNNNISNLEWCTCEYNNNYGTANQRTKETVTKKYGKTVLQLDKYTNEIITKFPSVHEAARVTGIDRSNIAACCKKKKRYKSAGGYIWRFEN